MDLAGIGRMYFPWASVIFERASVRHSLTVALLLVHDSSKMKPKTTWHRISCLLVGVVCRPSGYALCTGVR